MAIVVIQAPTLSAEQKRRIGDKILGALHQEGIPASSSIVLFRPEDTDLYLEGGLLHEASGLAATARTVPEVAAPASGEALTEPEPAELRFLPEAPAKPRGRRNKNELAELKEKLVKVLQTEGALSSFEAQAQLGLKEDDSAPATLRRFFGELEQAGLIFKQGQKRGTRYVWKGLVQSAPPGLPPVRLVKKSEE